MDKPTDTIQEIRNLARTLDGIDLPTYAEFDRDPMHPIIGCGPADAPVCFMGRDPGRDEVRLGLPFVGEAGQLLRATLHAHLHPGAPYSFEAGLQSGTAMFWMNTVPYKPLRNKVWGAEVRKRFHPCMARLLSLWHGADVVTLGNEAFFWFGIGQGRAVREMLRRFWDSGDVRYERSAEVCLNLDGGDRSLRIHPLPHPSRANTVWCQRFPDLLARRLAAILTRAR